MAPSKQASSKEADAPNPTSYESPWKLLVVFGVLMAAAVIYGVLT